MVVSYRTAADLFEASNDRTSANDASDSSGWKIRLGLISNAVLNLTIPQAQCVHRPD
jgi:hypothetical protein